MSTICQILHYGQDDKLTFYDFITGKVGSGTISIIPDSANPKSPLADLRVWQAIQHAIDNEALVQSVFNGEAEPANQWIYKGHWGYNPSGRLSLKSF